MVMDLEAHKISSQCGDDIAFFRVFHIRPSPWGRAGPNLVLLDILQFAAPADSNPNLVNGSIASERVEP